MALKFVKIAKIGEKIQSENTSRKVQTFQSEFFFEKCSYKLLIEINILKVIKGMSIFRYSFVIPLTV